MPKRIILLLKVFKIELEESENDIMALMEYYSGCFENHEITPYVCMENLALLKKEISCVKELEKDLSIWDPPDETDPQKVLLALNEYLKGLVVKYGYPELVSLVIDRITKKVSRYIE